MSFSIKCLTFIRWNPLISTPSRSVAKFIKPYYPPNKSLKSTWRKKQNGSKIDNIKPPEQFTKFDENFNSVVTFQQQVDSLQTRGFGRPYKPYLPPSDIDEIVCDALSQVWGVPPNSNLNQVKLDEDPSRKCELLKTISEKTGHYVPNSLLHCVTDADELLRFYRTKVSQKNPYERLESAQRAGKLPPNLHVQLEYVRFDPDNDHPFDQNTAFPGSSTIIVDPEARRKYKDVKAIKSPYEDDEYGRD